MSADGTFRVGALVLGLALAGFVRPAHAQGEPCAADEALEEALLLHLTGDEACTPLECARRAGSSASRVLVHRGEASDAEGLARFLAQTRRDAEGPVVCGEAEHDGRRIVFAAERAGTITVDADEDGHLVRFTLAPGFRDAYVVYQDANGRIERRAAGRDDVPQRIPEGFERPIQIQLVAEGARGPRPVAEQRLRSEDDEDDAQRTVRSIHARRGDEAIDARIARLRREARVGLLRPNRLLDEAANHYAQSICQRGRVVHRSAEGDGPRERLRARGVDARVVGETLARARSRAEALAGLEASPSHFATLVDRRFTDGGYGVATDARGKRCVVVVLAAWPRAIVRP